MAVKQPINQPGLGGSRRRDHCAYGVPITSRPSHRHVFAEDADARTRIPRKQLYTAESARFRDRADKSGFKNAHPLWGDALQQVEKGWLMPPTAHSADGRPYIVAPRDIV